MSNIYIINQIRIVLTQTKTHTHRIQKTDYFILKVKIYSQQRDDIDKIKENYFSNFVLVNDKKLSIKLKEMKILKVKEFDIFVSNIKIIKNYYILLIT